MASKVVFFSFIILIASLFFVTEARDFDMDDGLGVGDDFFNDGGNDFAKNNRAMEFSGVEDDSFEGRQERNRGLSNVAVGNSFGRHDNGSPFSTFEARGGGNGRTAAINARRKQQKEKKRERQQKKKQQREEKQKGNKEKKEIS